MKILLEQQGRHVIMQVVTTNVIDDVEIGVDLDWGAAIENMAFELKDRQGVKRMSYDTWHWDLRRRREAEAYVTYFYLKYGR